jgi:hypothetical protein
MASRECYECAVAGATMLWPPQYTPCPLCGGALTYDYNGVPIPDGEAGAIVARDRNRRAREAEFEAFYAKREDQRFLAELGATFDVPQQGP